jgi:ATP adenylyltransferase
MADLQKNIWAPWRMAYIEGLGGTGKDCFLCHNFAHPDGDAENHVLWRGQDTLVVLNRFPYNSGHVLIAPARHVAEFEDVPENTLARLMGLVRDTKLALQEAMRPQGFNIGINLGHCAGAGLPGHLHIHVVPRWVGDTNFMPVLDAIKVIPQSLDETRRAFLAAAEKLNLPASA